MANEKKSKKVHGKRYLESKKIVNRNTAYSVKDAVQLAKKAKYANFDETVEMHVNLGIDPKMSDQRIRFTTSLPHGTGQSIKILVISDDNSGEKGNVVYRDETGIADITAGKLSPDKDFNIVISTVSKMKDLAKVAKILGPRGMMPSPKMGTVTDDVEKTLKNLSTGQVEIRSQANHAVLHQPVGKSTFGDTQIEENVNHLISELNKNTPGKLKKRLIQSAYLSTTMGPGIRLSI